MATDRLLAAAGADHADLALVFASGEAYPAAHELLHAVRRVTGARVVAGCSGAGVLTDRREVEEEPAVAVLVVRDQRLVARPFLVRDVAGPVDLGAELGRQAGATVAEGGCLFLLADVAGLNPRALQGEPPAFGCYFNCAGRGRGLFGVPDHDVTLIRQHLGAFPLIGFFGNGEFAPIGRRNFFHNYTGALVVFPA